MIASLAGKRIGLLTASASRLGGGVFEAVAGQAALLRTLGAEPVVLALDDAHSAADAHRFAGAELHHAPVLGPRQVGFAPALGRMLDAARLDLLHLHGIWMYPSAAGAAWARRSGKPYLISPHGMLDPWITARGRWKKTLARAGYERRSWKKAGAFHALTEREAADIASECGQRGSLVIPNAGPEAGPVPTEPRAPLIACIGRIHPKKNLGALISGWTALEREGSLPDGARLQIAGWGEPQDVTTLQAVLAGAPDSIAFLGPQFGADKARLLSEAKFMVLPSLSEGLPMAVLEGWAIGTPTIMSADCNLPEGFAGGAALESGHDTQSIAAALRRAFELGDAEWLAMARAAHGLAAGPFAPQAIARRWEAAYLSLMNGAAT